MAGLGGDTWIDTREAAVTVRTAAGDETPLTVALTLLVPTPAAVARPLDPPALLMLATLALSDAQVTVVVRSCVELSVYTPVAVNCSVRPLAIDGLGGVTWIDTSVAAVTVSTALGEVTPLRAALMLLVPTPAAVATPLEPPALLMLATLALSEAQVTAVVRSCVELSL